MGSVVDSITGKDKKKEAERARREAEERLRQQEETRKREEEFAKKVQQDTEGLNQANQIQEEKTKPTTTVDFSHSSKVLEDDEEDKLKKAFRMGLRR